MEWKELKTKMDEKTKPVFNWLDNEFSKLRSGRVNIAIFNPIKVNAYDVLTPLSQLAHIQILDAKTVYIKPFDRHLVKEIASSLLNANLGCNILNEDVQIKLTFPPQTEENRKANVKKAKEILETAKARIRDVRKDIQGIYKKSEGVTEDLIKYFENELNKATHDYNEKLENIFSSKQNELMKI